MIDVKVPIVPNCTCYGTIKTIIAVVSEKNYSGMTAYNQLLYAMCTPDIHGQSIADIGCGSLSSPVQSTLSSYHNIGMCFFSLDSSVRQVSHGHESICSSRVCPDISFSL